MKCLVSCLILIAIVFCYHCLVNTKHRRTLATIFAKPTSPNIVFADIEALIKALGGSVLEREGSRVRIELESECWRCHRPHPGKEAKRYQVEEAREFLERVGVLP
jgi:HicA toxin of bacterial toxin-antitoxin,